MDAGGIGVELEVQLRECVIRWLANDWRDVWVREVINELVDSCCHGEERGLGGAG